MLNAFASGTVPPYARTVGMLHEFDRPVQREVLALGINGEEHQVLAPVHKTLLEVLREDLGLTGTKHGCELGECGTCTVLVDGRPQLSCLVLPIQVAGHEITTVEGLGSTADLHPLQRAFAELGAAQRSEERRVGKECRARWRPD